MHRFEKLNNLSINIFELNFYQEQNKWKCKLIPIEISENESNRAVDLLIYKNQNALLKNFIVFLSKQDCTFTCKRCSNSYTSENMIIKHKQHCIQKQKTSNKTSPESHLLRKNQFNKNPLYFRIYTDFEADNEKEDSKAGCNKINNIYKQIPVCNGCEIVSEFEEDLKSGYHKSPLGYENIDWFSVEIIKLENKMTFYFKNTNKVIIMTQEDEKIFEANNIFRFSEKQIIDLKVRDHCHLTRKYRGPAHSNCNINVKQKDSIFISVIIQNKKTTENIKKKYADKFIEIKEALLDYMGEKDLKIL